MQSEPPTSSQLAQTTSVQQPASPPTQAQRQAASKGALISMAVLLSIIVALVVYSLMRSLRKRDERIEKARQANKSSAPRIDAWAESARRLATPAASDLEDTKVGAQPPQDAPGAFSPQASAGLSSAGIRPSSAPIVLVTGASKRIGREIALCFARVGCDLVLTYNTSRTEAESLAREISAMGRQATLYQLALDDLSAVNAFAQRLASTLPRLDCLVHNASTYEPTPVRLDDDALPNLLQHEQAQRQMRVNALAPLALSLGLASALQRSILPGGGSIVALGDIHAMGHPRKHHSAYSMSKAALHEMVRTLARDLAPQIRVNALALGVAMWPQHGPETERAEQAKYLRRVPLGREGTPEEVAQAVLWLSTHATYATGQILPLDGGRGLT